MVRRASFLVAAACAAMTVAAGALGASAYRQEVAIVTTHRDAVRRLADVLLEHGALDGDQAYE